MEGILGGWRFKNKQSQRDDKKSTDSTQEKAPPATKTQGDAIKIPGANKAQAKTLSNTEQLQTSTQQSAPPETHDNRSRDMRLSKNTPSKPTEESFEIPAEPVVPSSYGSSPSRATDSSSAASPSAVIGPKITFKGELSGEEDLLIQGKVEGTVDLKGHHLTVGKQGVVKANLVAKSITIEGTIEGDLVGQERISIKSSSNVKGNLIAERVTLEDGARFRGSIDMDSKPSGSSSSFSSSSSTKSSATPTPEKA